MNFFDGLAKHLDPFDVEDPFNDGLRLEGHLCTKPDHRYGALVMDRVGGHPVRQQVIHCTPKLHYPFGRTPDEERKYHWPSMISRVFVYEKYDGTNVCGYTYRDHEGKNRRSFKTRLTPVLQESKWGDFLGMWREVCPRHELTGYPPLYSDSYEMFGARNPHTVVYKQSLEARHLFRVGADDGTLHLPPAWSRHAARIVATASADNELRLLYDRLREEADAHNSPEKAVNEGYIFYVESGPYARLSQWKCKPESIEQLHWASDCIPDPVVQQTAWNTLESIGDRELTPEDVTKLLAEEFTEQQLFASHARIEKAVGAVVARLAWRGEVENVYRATGVTAADSKGEVMRAMSHHFEKKRMRDVHSALVELGVVQ